MASAFDMSYADVQDWRRPQRATVEPPPPATPARPAAQTPRAVREQAAVSPRAQRTDGLYADANAQLAAPFQRQEVRRVDMLGGAELPRRALDITPRPVTPAGVTPAAPRRGAVPDATTRAAPRSMVDQIPGPSNEAMSAMARLNGTQAPMQASTRSQADTYSSSPERDAWQQRIAQETYPQRWREGVAREVMGRAQDDPFATGGTVSSVGDGGAAARALAIRESVGQGQGPAVGLISSGREEVPYQRQIDTILSRGANSRAQRAMLRELTDSQRNLLADTRGYAEMDQRGAMSEAERASRERLSAMGEAGSDRRQAAQLAGQQQLETQRTQSALQRDQAERDYNAPYRALQMEEIQQRMAPQMRQRPELSRAEVAALANSPDGGASAIRDSLAQRDAYDLARKSIMPALAQGATIEELLANPELRPFAVQLFDLRPRAPQQRAGQGTQNYAEGGLVQAASADTYDDVMNYQSYVDGSRRMGLPAVPFDRFRQMRAGAAQIASAQPRVQPYTAMGFADGGEIPDMRAMHMMGRDPHAAAGKMVVDMDPNAPTDSIPAMIDGHTPAKLDSGEFVFPEDVVKFFGTDKLNKMIAAARAGAEQKE